MIIVNNLSILSTDESFLQQLLSFRSYDKVQKALQDRGINISLDKIKKIKSIVYDLEENESIMTQEDLKTIEEAGNNLDINGYFNVDLYNFYYSGKNYSSDFFLNKEIYDGETISTGIFTLACIVFEAKKKYLRTGNFWEII